MTPLFVYWLLCEEVMMMRANLSRLITALRAETPPKQIWQKPFDYDPSHYQRLCNLNGKTPTNLDLCNYAHDMLYEVSPLQPDLLCYLLPICLEAWREDLLSNGNSEYGGFIEYFWAALANRKALQVLNPREYAEVETFMKDVLLDRIDQEDGLRFSGMGASPYIWFDSLGSFCVVFPALSSLWKVWWELTTIGQACAAIQYLSCLLYEDDNNPVFSPWTPFGGGGTPSICEVAGHIYEQGWREENVAFINETLTVEFAEDRLRYAAHMVQGRVQSDVPKQMLEDFEEQKTLLELRLEELPSLLAASAMDMSSWSI